MQFGQYRTDNLSTFCLVLFVLVDVAALIFLAKRGPTCGCSYSCKTDSKAYHNVCHPQQFLVGNWVIAVDVTSALASSVVRFLRNDAEHVSDATDNL